MSNWRYFKGLRRQKDKKQEVKPVTPWGPFCYLEQAPHPAPFNKTARAAERRREKKHKRQQREDTYA